jgi:hypothetical protein
VLDLLVRDWQSCAIACVWRIPHAVSLWRARWNYWPVVLSWRLVGDDVLPRQSNEYSITSRSWCDVVV